MGARVGRELLFSLLIYYSVFMYFKIMFLNAAIDIVVCTRWHILYLNEFLVATSSRQSAESVEIRVPGKGPQV